MVEVKEISAEKTLALRQSVLRPFLTLEQCAFEEDHLPPSFHLGAFHKGELMGIASFFNEDCESLKGKNSYRLRQMGTVPKMHGLGVGRSIIEKGLNILKEKKCDLLWCHARKVAFPFYEKVGFNYFGTLFDVSNIGLHKVMYRKI